MPDRIHFRNILKESTIDDMYGDVDSQDGSSCSSNKSWDMSKDGGQIDQKNIAYNDAVDDDKIDDLNKEDVLHFCDGLADNNNDNDDDNNYIKHGRVINQQENHFGGTNNNPQEQNKHFGGVNELDQNNIDKGEEQGKGANEGQNQGEDNNNHVQISEDKESYVDPDNNDNDLNDNQQHGYDSTSDSKNKHDAYESKDDNDRDPNDIAQDEEATTISRRNHNMSTQGNRLGNMVCGRPSANNDSGFDGPHWSASHICPMLSAMVVVEQTGVRMMKEYVEIEASKSTPQYELRKGLKLFGDEGYQAAKNELEVNLLGRDCIDMLSWKDLMWDIRKKVLGYLMFLKRKRSRK